MASPFSGNYPSYAPAAAAAPVPVRPTTDGVPDYLYPGDPGYPTGGPAAALGLPILNPARVQKGNPDYHEGDHLPGWSASGEALAQAYMSATTAAEQLACANAIAAFIGYPGADFSMGTPAFTAAAQFWQANNPHQ